MRLIEKLKSLVSGERGAPRRQPPPCVGCRGGPIDKLEQVDVVDGPSLSADAIVGPVAGLQTAVIDDQLVALDPATGERVLLNASAALIFTAIDAERRLSDVIDQISTETEVGVDVLQADVLATADRLAAVGMITDGKPRAGPEADLIDSPPALQASMAAPTSTWQLESGTRLIGGVPVALRAVGSVDASVFQELWDGFALVPDAAPSSRLDLVQSESIDADVGGEPRLQMAVDGVLRSARFAPDTAPLIVLDELDEIVANRAPGLRFHAGAVERHGQVVVVLGQSGDGKSTLTAALVQHGFAYLSDEVVVVEGTERRVHPYARPLDLDGSARDNLGISDVDLVTGRRKDKVVPSQLGRVSDGGVPVLIVLLTGEPREDDRSLCEPFPPAEALMALLPLTFGPTFEHPDALANLAELCTHARPVRMARGPVEEMVVAIEAALADPIRPTSG